MIFQDNYSGLAMDEVPEQFEEGVVHAQGDHSSQNHQNEDYRAVVDPNALIADSAVVGVVFDAHPANLAVFCVPSNPDFADRAPFDAIPKNVKNRISSRNHHQGWSLTDKIRLFQPS